MHPAWLAPWEHCVPCTDYGPPDMTDNLLERCTAPYERFDAAPSPKHAAWAAMFNTGEDCENCEANVDAYASEMTCRPGDEDGEDDGQPAEEDGEDDEQPAEEDGKDDEQLAEEEGEDDGQLAEEDGEDDGRPSPFHALGYQYHPMVPITLTNRRLSYRVPIPEPGTAWLAPRTFSDVFNRNLTLLMNDDRRSYGRVVSYIIRQSLTFRCMDTHDWISNHRPSQFGAFHTGMVHQPGAEEHTINTAALRMHMQPHMLESLLAEWPQRILRVLNIQHAQAGLLYIIGGLSDGRLIIRHDPDYALGLG